jgi:cytochrome oxidase Cu insertion factor (SCO1/SenC/PrrC family)
MRAAAVVLAALVLCGCEVVDRPNKSVPDDFSVTLSDRTVVGKKQLAGEPWVINFWLPG